MKFRMGETIGDKVSAIQLSKVRNVCSTLEIIESIRNYHKLHLYKTKSCKFDLLTASVYHHCSISSISQFIPKIEERIVLYIFYPHLEDIQQFFESKRKYTNYHNIQN